jgi:hypothetical protein
MCICLVCLLGVIGSGQVMSGHILGGMEEFEYSFTCWSF